MSNNCYENAFERCEHDTCTAISAVDQIDETGFTQDQIDKLDKARALLVAVATQTVGERTRIIIINDRWDRSCYLRVATSDDADIELLERLAKDHGLVAEVWRADSVASARRWLEQL